MKISIKSALRLCRKGNVCCFVAALGGMAYLGNLCTNVLSAPADMTPLWLAIKIAQMLFAIAVIYCATDMCDELIYMTQWLEREQYKELLSQYRQPMDRRHDA